MKNLIMFLFLSLLAVFFVNPEMGVADEDKSKSVNERILEILIEKDVIKKKQYEELKKQAREEKKDTQEAKVAAGFNKGFYIETTDKKNKIRFDGRFHGDFKAYFGDHPDHASFFVRRARLCVSGTIHKYYDFRLEPEFGRGGSRLNDGFMNIRWFPQAQLMYGQFKAPFSMEELHSDNWIDFVERSLANKLAPSRDLGMMLHGGLRDEMFYYQLGIFNGYKLNQASDPDGGKDVVLRLIAAPYKESKMRFLEGLRFGLAMTRGTVTLGNDDWWNSGDFKTAAGTTYLAMANGVSQDGDRTRKGLELHWDWGSTVLKGEYMIAELDGVKRGTLSNDFDIKGGYVSISQCLTGEKFVYKRGKPGRITPLKPFENSSSDWGAFQVSARWEFLKADHALLDLGYVDSSQYTNKASGFTLGLNWYPNDIVRFMFNFNHVEFNDSITVRGKRFEDEDVMLTRFEVAL